MPDHPQSIKHLRPNPAFRDSFLRLIELPLNHAAAQGFGHFLDDLFAEGRLALIDPRDRPTETYFQTLARALVLDLEAVRFNLANVAKTVGEADDVEDSRLALTMADLLPRVEEVGATLRAALERSTGPQAPAGADDGA